MHIYWKEIKGTINMLNIFLDIAVIKKKNT